MLRYYYFFTNIAARLYIYISLSLFLKTNWWARIWRSPKILDASYPVSCTIFTPRYPSIAGLCEKSWKALCFRGLRQTKCAREGLRGFPGQVARQLAPHYRRRCDVAFTGCTRIKWLRTPRFLPSSFSSNPRKIPVHVRRNERTSPKKTTPDLATLTINHQCRYLTARFESKIIRKKEKLKYRDISMG